MIFFIVLKSSKLLNFSIFKNWSLKAKHTLKVKFLICFFRVLYGIFKNLRLLCFLDNRLCYNFSWRLAL